MKTNAFGRFAVGSLFLILALVAFSSCQSLGSAVAAGSSLVPYPEATFSVITDTHFYDPSFGVSGPAWDNYMRNDRKLLAESAETNDQIFSRILASRPQFVLICGDLTKDGEADGHRLFATRLKTLADAGIAVYVIPGNHDIDNPDAVKFTASGKESIPSVTPAEFTDIYDPYGYGRALYRDPASLSYIAEPVPGLWLLAIDSTKYEHNDKLGYPETSGLVRPETIKWIESRLGEAREKGKAVIAMEHHPLFEHAYDMKSKYPEYVLDNGDELSRILSSNGVRFIFTGHFHAHSIVKKDFKSGYVVDVETNSPVTWPCAYRTVRFGANGDAVFSTDRVKQLESYAQAGRAFDTEGYASIANGLKSIATTTMKKLRVPDADCALLTDGIIAAMMAHYAGDAKFAGTDVLPTDGLSLMGRIVVAAYTPFIEGLWKTRAPKGIELMADNNLTVHADGSWEAAPVH